MFLPTTSVRTGSPGPTDAEPREAQIPERKPPASERAASDPGLAQSGRAGVRARKGRLEWLGRREAPMSAASPEPMCWARRTRPVTIFFRALSAVYRTFVQRRFGRSLYG